MAKFVVAVINGTQARFFTLDSAIKSEYESSPNLIEQGNLSDPTKELHGQELWANTKTGRNRGSKGQNHNYDDHRQNHKIEFEKRFANKISSTISKIIQKSQAKQLVLVAEPHILGIMREVMDNNLVKQINIQELAKDIGYFDVNQIHDYLAKKELVPACQRVYSR